MTREVIMKSIKEANVKGKRVLLRTDFNVPLKNGRVEDNSRIKAHLETVNYLLGEGAKVIIISHLGRPKGERDDDFSLKPIYNELKKLLPKKIVFIPEVIGQNVQSQINALKEGEVAILENLRFQIGEEANDRDFSETLADYADIFVQDAFSNCHREHAWRGVPGLRRPALLR